MRVVDKPSFTPARCAAIPFLGPSSHPDERWVDTGAEMEGWQNRVYISETAIRQCMSLLGFASPAEVEQLRADLADAEENALLLLEQLKEQDAVIEGSEVVKAFTIAEAKRAGMVTA